ncbi:MAG: heme ABC exporter ATP-binding protein CcmA [Rhodospirillaceae bacterium]|nr:heme ABC exporter ATP-binding protein CcmA [Rhodospirillaceae bacterium]
MGEFTGNNLTCVRSERIVFSGLDFTLAGGGALVLVGSNGSGKSSLLRLMAGLLHPASGVIAFDGAETSEDPEAHSGRLHYVGHLDAVKPVLSVSENVAFWASLRSGGGNVPQALSALGINHLADVPGRFLSAGQKRRVNLARIVAAPAPLWLLDEPTTALDKQTIAGLERTIADHRGSGGMVVISTHSDLALDNFQTLDLGHFSAGRTGNP